jgi:alkanesulfonate monooxygenase SsuD/methylene tetrahydromethanopterin reductase-like flavin-dependent oxidoreductase (luciferase family)
MGEEKTLRIVAEHADGWNAFPLPIPQIQQKLAVLRGHCEAVRRDYDAISKQLGIRAIVRQDRADVESELKEFSEQSQLPVERARQIAIAGTPAEVADALQPYVEIGFDMFLLMERIPLDYETLQLFIRDVVPRLRDGQ